MEVDIQYAPKIDDPFKQLVRTILSQNTNRVNTSTAFNRLDNRIILSPRNLANAPKRELIQAIKPAGMYNQRSEVLKQVSTRIIDDYAGNIEVVVNKPLEEARAELMSLPGVGPKTADVVLLFSSQHNVMPVDRHIERVAKRIGLVNNEANYEEIRKTIETNALPEKYKALHLKLIEFGREICKSRNPRCHKCFLYSLCTWPNKG